MEAWVQLFEMTDEVMGKTDVNGNRELINSLTPGIFRCDSKNSLCRLVLLIGTLRACLDKALRWMPWDLTDGKSTPVQVMALCRQATSRYLSQRWPRSMSSSGVTRPHWVNSLWPSEPLYILVDIGSDNGMTCNGVTCLYQAINTLRPRQNGRRFADDTFKSIFLNEGVRISINISLKFVPQGPINNNPALVQIMIGAGQATSHYLNQWWLVYWRIYASLGLNE